MSTSKKSNQHKPPHFPFEDPPFRLSMGLLKVHASEWFEILDLEERAVQLNEKQKLLTHYPNEIFRSDPSALPASKEVLELMLEHLPTFRPDLYSRTGDAIKLIPHSGYDGEAWTTDFKTTGIHPLNLAGRLVQEDLVVMLPPDQQQTGWWLAAGSVAFPSRWCLKEKFGRTMDDIHAPVPFYKEQLQAPTNNFFDQMPVDEIYSRRNWSIHDTPALRQDGTDQKNDKNIITSKNAGEELWLRVERQTIRKLKESGAILFTIRIHLRKLKHILKYEGVSGRLAKALSALPPEMQAYKQTDTFANVVRDYLNQF